MKKFMKFTMFEKDSKDTKYRDDPYRAVIFPIDESGSPVCPNGKKFNYIYSRAVRGNKYGRTEEFSNAKTAAGVRSRTNAANARATELSV